MPTFVGKICKSFKGLDMLGSSLELNIEGSGSFKTQVGGFLSIICFGMVIWFIIRSTQKIFDKENPKILQLTENKLEEFKLDFQHSGLMPMVMFLETTTYQPLPAKYHPALATMFADFETSTLDQVTSAFNYEFKRYPLVPCDSLKNKKPYEHIFNDKNLKTSPTLVFSCIEVPETDSINIFGNRLSSKMGQMQVVVYPCAIPDQTQCFPGAMVKKYSFNLFDYRSYIRFSDFKDPIKSYLSFKEGINFLDTMGTQLIHYLNQVNIRDITNWFLPKNKQKGFVNIESERLTQYMRTNTDYCTIASLTDKSCPAYLKVEYRASGIYHSYERTYTDIIEAYSEVGGLKELVFLGSMFVYMFYNGFAMSSFLRNKLVNLDSIRTYLLQSQSKLRLGVASSGPSQKNQESVPLKPSTNSPQSGSIAGAKDVNSQIAELKDALDELVETNLDISTLVSELNNWKILRQLVFKPYHLELLPLVAVEVDRKHKLQASPRPQERALKDSLVHPGNPETSVLRHAVVQLAERKRSHPSKSGTGLANNGQPLEDVFAQIQDGVDDFFLANLPAIFQQDIGTSSLAAESNNTGAKHSHQDFLVGDIEAEGGLFNENGEKVAILARGENSGGSRLAPTSKHLAKKLP